MANPIQVLPESTENTQGISVLPDGTGSPGNPVNEEVAKARASKANWAIGDEARTYDATYNAITSGYESVTRSQDAVNKQLEERKRRLGVIQEMTKEGKPLDPVERDMIISLSQDKLQNPNTVWEEEYAKKVVDTALTIQPFPQFDESMSVNPEDTLDAMDAAQNSIARKEIAQHKLESLNQQWETLSIGSKVADFGLTMVPFYSWYNLQNRLENAQATSVLPGNNQLEQIEYLHSLPPDQFEIALDQALQEISKLSVLDAMTFAQGALGMPASEVGLTNTFGVLDALDVAVAPAAALAKAGSRAARRFGRQATRASQATQQTTQTVVPSATPVVPSSQVVPRSSISSKVYRTEEGWVPMSDQAGWDAAEDDMYATAALRVNGKTYLDQAGVRTNDSTHLNAQEVAIQDIRTNNPDWTEEQAEKYLEELIDAQGGPQESYGYVLHPNAPQPLKQDITKLGSVLPEWRDLDPSDQVQILKDPVRAVKGTLKSIVKAVGEPDATVGKVVAATGDIDSGAILEASKRYRDKLVTGNVPDVKEMRSTLPSIFNPGGFFDNAKGKTNAIVKSLESNAEILARTLTDMNSIERLTPEALRKAGLEAVEALKQSHWTVNSAILDIGEELLTHNPQTNTYTASINVGTFDKKLFSTPDKAFRWAEDVYKLPENSYSLEQQGTGYYIKVSKDLDETSDSVRDLIVPTEGTRDTMANMYLGLLRTPEELLDADLRGARHTATYAPGEFQRAVRPMLDTIQSLGKKGRDRLSRVLEANRDHIEIVDGKPNRGKYYNSVSDFETDYKDITGVSPTDNDVQAYFTYRQLSDYDYMIRNFGIYRDYVRQGAEQANFTYYMKDANGNVKTANTQSFVVKRVDTLPFDNPEDAGIFVYNSEAGKAAFRRKNSASADLKEYIDDLVNNKGYKVLQVFNPNDMPMRQTFGIEDVVNFVVVRDTELTRLSWNPLPYNEGPHVAYQSPYFVKQAKVRQTQEVAEVTDAEAVGPVPEGHTRLWSLSEPGAETPVYHGGPLAERKLRDAQRTTGGEVRYIDIPASEASNYKVNPTVKKNAKGKGRVVGGEYRIPKDVEANARRPAVRTQGETRNIYEGDKAIFGATSEAEAKKYSVAMEKARVMLNNDAPELDDFVNNNLPFSPREFRTLFEDVVHPDGTTRKAEFDKNQKFVWTASGQGVNDVAVDGVKKLRDTLPNFEDTVDSSYNLFRNINKKYAGERNQSLWRPIETQSDEGKPLITLGNAPLLDPMTTINDSLSNVIRGRYFDDVKIKHVEQFVQEFRDVLKNTPEQMKNDPVSVLHKPQWDDANASNSRRIEAAKNFRRATLRLIGTDTTDTKFMKIGVEKLISQIYDFKGQNASDFTAYHLMPKMTDPFRYVRAMAFHLKLGLFNPVQVFVQGQTFAHILALSPKHAPSATAASSLMRMLSLTDDDKIIRHYAKMATKSGWTEDEFIESFTEMKRTGMYNVEGEHSWKNDMVNMNLVQTKGGKVLDMGTFFFKETERAIRMTAWNAAFKEWRSKNTGRFDNRARALVVTRANDMTVNMTRASNASWNEGLLSVPTQFFSYQLRLMDQLLGKRLTTAEKARVAMVYSAMYGVPTAAGAYLGVVPIKEMIDKYAMENGVNLSDNVFSQMVTEGLPATLMQMVSGEEYNVASRYGPGGLTIIKDIMRGDSSLTDLVFGASGSILGDVLSNGDPILRGIMDVFKEDGYPLMAQDFIDATQNISSVNNAMRVYYAMNVGKWYSRNGVYMDDIGGWEALFMGMTGLSPKEMSDSFLKIESLTDTKNEKNAAKKEIVKNIQRALRAEGPEESEQFFTAARALLVAGGFMPNEYAQIMKEASMPQSLIDSVNVQFIEKAPMDQKDSRTQDYLNSKLQKAHQ